MPGCGSPTALELADGRCVGVELETLRKAARVRGDRARRRPGLDEVWWFAPAPDVTWLADVLAEIPKPARPVHLVLDLAGVAS